MRHYRQLSLPLWRPKHHQLRLASQALHSGYVAPTAQSLSGLGIEGMGGRREGLFGWQTSRQAAADVDDRDDEDRKDFILRAQAEA